MSLVQSVPVSFESEAVTFSGNVAEVSGGAVFVTGTGIGPKFANVTFVGNSAQTGGGVHATGSGNELTKDVSGNTVEHPMTFDGCSFLGNYAFATGGAVDSASGKDVFVNTIFKGNEARVGGALRLAGMASVDNCSFVENISELGGGPAVSNIGYMSSVTNNSFYGNVFNCEPKTFLYFNMVSLFPTLAL